MEIWTIVKQVFMDEDQLPTAKGLAERAEIGERWAAQFLTRFRERGLLVRNSMGGYRFRRGKYKIVVMEPRRAKNFEANDQASM